MQAAAADEEEHAHEEGEQDHGLSRSAIAFVSASSQLAHRRAGLPLGRNPEHTMTGQNALLDTPVFVRVGAMAGSAVELLPLLPHGRVGGAE